MSTNITTAYNAMITRLAAVLTSHKRLTNPYNLSDNTHQFLTIGYGLAIGPAENTRRILGCLITQRRELQVVITRKYFATQFDVSGKSTTEKQILEDLFLVVKDFEKSTNLNDTNLTTQYVSDSGIEFVDGDGGPFLAIRATFSLDYQEDITT
jgi:hypothetical protein